MSQFCRTHGNSLRNVFLIRTNFLVQALRTIKVLWQEGFYIDFLQKKITDKFLRRTVIFSNILYSEGSVFRRLVNFYWSLLVWPLHLNSGFIFGNPVFKFILLITWYFAFILITLLYIILFFRVIA